MPSPFPGMNPFLEQEDVWQDFHDSFIPAARAAGSIVARKRLKPSFSFWVDGSLGRVLGCAQGDRR